MGEAPPDLRADERPEPKPAPERRPTAKPTPAPRETVRPTREPKEASLEASLRVLGARPVSEHQEKKKDKPKTAKEALLARATQRTGKPAPGKKKKRGAASRDRAPTRAAETEPDAPASSSEESESSDSSPPAPPRRGLWERVKRLFRPG